MMTSINFIDPGSIFLTEPPVMIKNLPPRDYYDKSEIGMISYLQILPSVALYGFKYAAVLDSSNRVLDGNFKTYAAVELGLKVPCVCRRNREGLPRFLYRLVWKMRRLIKINYLFQRKFLNSDPATRKKILLVCQFQEDILS